MVSVRMLCTLMDWFGLIKFHSFDIPWKDQLQSFHIQAQLWVLLFRYSCELYNTVTRSWRYQPELVQSLVEDCIMGFYIYSVVFLRKKKEDMTFFCDFIDHEFSKADRKVVQNCHRRSKITFLFFLVLIFGFNSLSVLESLLPLSKNEYEIRTNVHRTKHPERRLPYNLRIPFVDESESWAYEIVYFLDTMFLIPFSCRLTLLITVVPVMIIHLEGQYKILCKYIRMIGQEHRDAFGNIIFYSDIEKDQYFIRLYSPLKQGRKGRMKNWFNLMKKLKRHQEYELNYLGQIIRFHKKLLLFQERVRTKY
ncbi:hypothetical protein WDU94_011069 [Cyamophila willieti]